MEQIVPWVHCNELHHVSHYIGVQNLNKDHILVDFDNLGE